MTNSTAENAAPELDFKQILAQLLAKKTLVILSSTIGALVGIVIGSSAPNQYRSNSAIQIERRSENITLPAELIGTLLAQSGGAQSPNFATEAHVIKSRLVLEPVAEQLHLKTEVTRKILPMLGSFLVENQAAKALPALEGLIPRSYARGTETLHISRMDVPSGLEGVPFKLTSLGGQRFAIEIDNATFNGTAGAATALGRFGTVTVDQIEAEQGRVFFLKKLPTRSIVARLSNGLAINERGTTGIIDFSYTDKDRALVVPILNAVIETYQSNNLQSRSAEIDQSIAFIAQQLPIVSSDLEKSKQTLIDFQNKSDFVRELSSSTQDLLDRIVADETDLNRLDFEIEQVLKRVTKNHPDYVTLDQERSRVTTRLQQAKTELDKIPQNEQTLASLTGELEKNRSLELQLNERISQLRILKASTVGNVRVLEPAEVASLSGPNRLTPVLFGLLIGFAIAVAGIFTRNYFKTGIEDGKELEELGLPLFATIFKYTAQPNSSVDKPVALIDPDSPIVEAFRGLRTSLQFSLASAQSKVVMFTSTSSGQGKSFTCANLAVVLATGGKKVLLIDADMRRGKLHKAFDTKLSASGLSALLAGSITPMEAVEPTEVDGLDLLHRGKRPPNPAELLEKANFKDLLSWANQIYDFIIVDTPPILAVTDAAVIGQNDLVTIIVVRHMETNLAEISTLQRTLSSSGVKISGAILNHYDPKRSKYGSYGYKYGYYYGGDSYSYKNDA